MSHTIEKQVTDKKTISGKTVRHILTNEKKVKGALQSVESELKTLRLGISFTADQVADVIQKSPQLMQNITISLVNSFSFRKKISEEILVYLLEKEEKSQL